jgi:hypothetical protein
VAAGVTTRLEHVGACKTAQATTWGAIASSVRLGKALPTLGGAIDSGGGYWPHGYSGHSAPESALMQVHLTGMAADPSPSRGDGNLNHVHPAEKSNWRKSIPLRSGLT